MAANITPVGNGPFGVRPRLRGLDSTRLLVLVDGERLNTARQATDRTGAEVGLVSPDAISRMEVVNGAGTLMYGSDALAGTINIITNEAAFTPSRPVALRLQRLLQLERERHARHRHRRVSRRRATRCASRRARKTSTTTRPATSTSRTRGPCFESGVARPGRHDRRQLRLRLQRVPGAVQRALRAHRQRGAQLAGERQLRERVEPDQAGRAPLACAFATSGGGWRTSGSPTSHSPTSSTQRRCRTATSIACRRVTRRRRSRRGWPTCRLTAYYQRTERLLQNLLPVQFPAPTPTAFFPISVFRLDVLSEHRAAGVDARRGPPGRARARDRTTC